MDNASVINELDILLDCNNVLYGCRSCGFSSVTYEGQSI